MAYSFDVSHPADNDYISDYPANERAERTSVKNIYTVEHYEGTGRHKVGSGDETARDGAIGSPEVGNYWIDEANGLLDVHDGADWHRYGIFVAGDFKMVAYDPLAPPDGWLPCDGASLLRASYPDLFTKIGVAFGSADGTHFNVPNMDKNVPAGLDSATGGDGYDAIGETGGEATHVLTEAETAQRSIAAGGGSPTSAPTATPVEARIGAGSWDTVAFAHTHVTNINHGHTLNEDASGDAHENRAPYVTVGFLIKT